MLKQKKNQKLVQIMKQKEKKVPLRGIKSS